MLCLENLFIYLDYIAYCYSDHYEDRSFDKSLIISRLEKAKQSKEIANAVNEELIKEQKKSAKQELDLQKLIEENASLKEALSARRQEQQQTYVPKPLDLSEYKTRKLYIDSMLMDAGWTEGKDWMNEVEVSGMPNKSGIGFADYVLYDDMHRPLAIIEAKRTCVDVAKGRQQAKLYADLLEKEYKRRPVIFLNHPLTSTDIASLEEILWQEIGTKQDYEQEIGTKPLGEFVREIVGLDMNAAKEAFSEYLTNTSLDSRQIYFVNQIIEYIVHNGMMKDLSVLQESPFTDQGSVVEIFTDLNVWMGIRKVIDTINANAAA